MWPLVSILVIKSSGIPQWLSCWGRNAWKCSGISFLACLCLEEPHSNSSSLPQGNDKSKSQNYTWITSLLPPGQDRALCSAFPAKPFLCQCLWAQPPATVSGTQHSSKGIHPAAKHTLGPFQVPALSPTSLSPSLAGDMSLGVLLASRQVDITACLASTSSAMDFGWLQVGSASSWELVSRKTPTEVICI